MVSVLRGGPIWVWDFILWPKEIPQFSKGENSANFRFNLKVPTDCKMFFRIFGWLWLEQQSLQLTKTQPLGLAGLQVTFLLTGSYSSSQTSSMRSLTLVCSASPEMIEWNQKTDIKSYFPWDSDTTDTTWLLDCLVCHTTVCKTVLISSSAEVSLAWHGFCVVALHSSVLFLHSSEAHFSVVFYWRAL